GVLIEEDASPEVLASRGLSRVEEPMERPGFRVTGLCDVACTLLAEAGALSAMSFVRQKGFVSESQVAMVGDALRFVAAGTHSRSENFGGAGGGLGYAIGTTPGGYCCSGADYVIDTNSRIFENASLIITGEGSIDVQTAGGKCVEALRRYGLERGIPVLAVGGRVAPEAKGEMILACQAFDAPIPSSPEASERVEMLIGKWATENFDLCI
ncbi:MAG: glycerate kinase, partial [Muribaculaceae bacterium]|nr:glycerate kinase [Muribaculaceae bacterium]